MGAVFQIRPVLENGLRDIIYLLNGLLADAVDLFASKSNRGRFTQPFIWKASHPILEAA